jgi:hypothetical protein
MTFIDWSECVRCGQPLDGDWRFCARCRGGGGRVATVQRRRGMVQELRAVIKDPTGTSPRSRLDGGA